MSQSVEEVIIVELNSPKSNPLSARVAFFKEDGTPFSFSVPPGGVSEALVESLIDAAIVEFATEAFVEAAVFGLASEGFVEAAVLGFTTEAFVEAAVLGLASEEFVEAAVVGLASQAYVATAVYGLATEAFAEAIATSKVADAIEEETMTVAPSQHIVFNALALKENLSQKGTANGYAELDSNGWVPSAQLPSFVDDVIDVANFAALPGTGASGKIYITIDDGKTYRWSGSVYGEISASLALGETSTTAYRGDRGKIGYDHSQVIGNPHGTTKTDVGLGNVNDTSDVNKPVSTAQASAIATAVGDHAGASDPHAQYQKESELGSAAFVSTATFDPAGAAASITKATLGLGNVDDTSDANKPPATTTAKGIVELATTSEIDTGTDSTRAMPVDQFVASGRNVRYIMYRVMDSAANDATGTSIGGDLEIPITGTIVEIGAYVDTAGVTGLMTIDVNKNGTTLMTTNKITIDSTEKTSRTAATAPALTTTAIAAGDIVTVDVDGIQSTPAKGLTIRLGVRLT